MRQKRIFNQNLASDSRFAIYTERLTKPMPRNYQVSQQTACLETFSLLIDCLSLTEFESLFPQRRMVSESRPQKVLPSLTSSPETHLASRHSSGNRLSQKSTYPYPKKTGPRHDYRDPQSRLPSQPMPYVYTEPQTSFSSGMPTIFAVCHPQVTTPSSRTHAGGPTPSAPPTNANLPSLSN